jgi:hypothetical protein
MRFDGDFQDAVMLAGEQVVGGNEEIYLTERAQQSHSLYTSMARVTWSKI